MLSGEVLIVKTVIINGQNHKGSTYHISRMLAEKVGGEIKEFFLPRDFGEFCVGCTSCFMKTETLCPHYSKLKPLTDAMDEADLIILASPVYVMHATGPMKAFLDHYGYRFIVHRPEEKMFCKQAVCISTAAGAGMKRTNKDMSDSLFYWGVSKIYCLGYAVHAVSFDTVPKNTMSKIESDTDRLACRIKKNKGHVYPGFRMRVLFFAMHKIKGFSEADHAYWVKKGWDTSKRPWK